MEEYRAISTMIKELGKRKLNSILLKSQNDPFDVKLCWETHLILFVQSFALVEFFSFGISGETILKKILNNFEKKSIVEAINKFIDG